MGGNCDTYSITKDEKLQDCLNYFLASATLMRLLTGFYEKYRSFGTVRGSVQLRGLSEEGIEALEGLTGKNFHGKKSAAISAEKIQKCLDNSCYAGVTLDELVTCWNHGQLKSKKQERQENEEQYAAFFGHLAEEYEGTAGGRWLREVLEEHGEEERILRRRFRECNQSGRLRKEIETLIIAINCLPVWTDSYEYLPIYAAKVSGDPHYFDHKEKDTYLFYYAIHHVLRQDRGMKMPISAEKRHELLLLAGIIVDPVSNDAMVYGLRAWSAGEEHLGMQGFCEKGEPLSITLSTIMKLDCVKCRGGQAYVVENPTVFARLVETDTGDMRQNLSGKISAICGNGQPNQAVLQLLDRIVRGNATIYYNGDYDPEGLCIAQRLKDRYGEQLILWHYTKEDYLQALSNKPVAVGRMKMMDRLSAPELVRIAELIRETGRAGYQERVELTL